VSRLLIVCSNGSDGEGHEQHADIKVTCWLTDALEAKAAPAK
jgi:hypothetical protein